MVIVDYDLMVAKPVDVIKLIYEFLGEPAFDHDLDNIEYDAQEFDADLGIDGLHRVHRKLAPRPRQTILPPDLFAKYSNLAFWHDLPNSKAFRIVVQSDEPVAGEMPKDA